MAERGRVGSSASTAAATTVETIPVPKVDGIEIQTGINDVRVGPSLSYEIDLFGKLLDTMRADRTEEEFLRHGERIGPYLTCLRGLAFGCGALASRRRGRRSCRSCA